MSSHSVPFPALIQYKPMSCLWLHPWWCPLHCVAFSLQCLARSPLVLVACMKASFLLVAVWFSGVYFCLSILQRVDMALPLLTEVSGASVCFLLLE